MDISVIDRHDNAVFMIHSNGVFKYDPLRYEEFRVVEAYTTDRVKFSPLLDMLVAKLKNNICALFLCILGLDIDSSDGSDEEVTVSNSSRWVLKEQHGGDMTHHYQWRWLWAKEGTSVDVAASDGMVKGGRGVEKEQKFSAFSISTIIKATRVVVKSSGDDVNISRGSGTTARGRSNNVELRNVLGDTIGNPDQMRLKVEDRIRKKGRDFHKPKTGSVVAFKVTFRDFSPVGSNIWFKLYGPPSDPDVDLIGTVIYRQIHEWNTILFMMPSSFHDVGDVEFQDNWGRVWVDIGTSDYFALDVLLNCLTVVFGGQSMGDWEEGMKNPEDGYKSFKI
ncbi:hypothetical protein Tco_0173439 [Tanacetum coccineum]